ncbi:MAG: ComEC family competence protein [Chitinophagaceae bacterium]|nr:ComEC family competence protein [Chitinophagaceae bacterium]
MRMHPTLIRYWIRTPFLLPLAGLIAGIITQANLQLNLTALGSILAGCIICIFLFFSLPLRVRFQQSKLGYWIAFLLFWATSLLLTQLKDIRNQKNWLGKFINEESFHSLELVVVQDPVERTKTIRLFGKATSVKTKNKRIPVTGNVLIYVPKKDSLRFVLPGDRLLIYKAPVLIQGAGNPGEINWVRHYAQEDCTHRLFLKEGEYVFLKKEQHNYRLARFISQLRQHILSCLHETIPDKNAAGLAAALLIGYRQELDPVINQSYSNTGVVHIIAISGMHLALIGWLLQQIFSPFQKNKITQLLSQLLIISIIWLFSLLAGATPSVLRAALSFSIATAGIFFERKPNSLNSLFAAGFFLLLLQPLWVWDLGFQLSFLAVLSILLFGKPLQQFSSDVPKWLNQPVQLMAVTTAAQILTLPLTLYYFHQFPASFLLSNLIAIPLSTCILYVLMAILGFGFIPVMGLVLGQSATYLIQLMNQLIQWIEKLPGFIWRQLYWTVPETILLTFLLLAAGHWLINQSKTGFYYTTILLCLLCSLQWYTLQRRNKQSQLVIYNTTRLTAFTWIQGKTAISFTTAKDEEDSIQLRYLTKPCEAVFQVRQHQFNGLVPIVALPDFNLMIPDRSRLPPASSAKPVHFLLVSRMAPFKGLNWLKARPVQLAVLDATLGTKTRNEWRRLLEKEKIPFYDIRVSGAFVHSLR